MSAPSNWDQDHECIVADIRPRGVGGDDYLTGLSRDTLKLRTIVVDKIVRYLNTITPPDRDAAAQIAA